MPVQSYLPAPELAPYVEQYCLWDHEAAAAPAPHPVLPRLDNGLHVLGAEPNGAARRAENQGPVVELLGLTTQRQLYPAPTSRAGMLGVYFRPTGCFSLFGAPLAAGANEPAAPDSSIARFARELAWSVRQASSPEAGLGAAESLLLRHVRQRVPTPSTIAPVAESIRARHGQLSMEALARAANLSRRQLERRFVAEVGLTPKLYARIARFSHVLQLLKQASTLDWPGISYQCGYFDQAHFIREFRSFTGQAPGEFLHHYHDFARFF